MRFLGADSVIVPLKDSLNANLATWDWERMPRANLEAVLGISFPPPKVCASHQRPNPHAKSYSRLFLCRGNAFISHGFSLFVRLIRTPDLNEVFPFCPSDKCLSKGVKIVAQLRHGRVPTASF